MLERATKRAKETGRVVPEDTLKMSITKTAKSVEILGPMADFLAVSKIPDYVAVLYLIQSTC